MNVVSKKHLPDVKETEISLRKFGCHFIIQPMVPHEPSPGSHSTSELSIEENMSRTLVSQFIKLETLAIISLQETFYIFCDRCNDWGARFLGFSLKRTAGPGSSPQAHLILLSFTSLCFADNAFRMN